MKWSTEEDRHFLDLALQYGSHARAIHEHWHDAKREVQPGVFEAWRDFSLDQIQNKIGNTARELSKLGVRNHPLISESVFRVHWECSADLAKSVVDSVVTTNAQIIHPTPKRRRTNYNDSPRTNIQSPQLQQPTSPNYPDTSFQSNHYSYPQQISYSPQAPHYPQHAYPPQLPQPQHAPPPCNPERSPRPSTTTLDHEDVQKRREAERQRRESMGNTTGISLQPHQFPRARAAPIAPTNIANEWDSPSSPRPAKNENAKNIFEGEKDEYAIVSRMIDQSLVTTDNLCTFDDVKGSLGIKYSLTADLIIATKLGGELPNVLLYGPPGTGKTMIAYAIAQYLKMSCILVTPATFGSAFKGRSEMACKALFQRAEYYSPCLIFFDEAECIFGERTNNDHHAAEKNTLLAYMNTSLASARAQVCCVAATNLPWKIDRGFLRRFDTKIYVPLPTADDISQLLAHLLSKGPQIAHLQYADDIDTLQIANLLSQKKFSNSDVCNFVKKIPKKALLASPLWELVKNGGDDLAVPPEMNVVISSEFIKSCIDGYTDHTPPDETILKEYTLGSWTSK